VSHRDIPFLITKKNSVVFTANAFLTFIVKMLCLKNNGNFYNLSRRNFGINGVEISCVAVTELVRGLGFYCEGNHHCDLPLTSKLL
jgi:hypothetical protein